MQPNGTAIFASTLSTEDKLEICEARCRELIERLDELKRDRDNWQAQAERSSMVAAAAVMALTRARRTAPSGRHGDSFRPDGNAGNRCEQGQRRELSPSVVRRIKSDSVESDSPPPFFDSDSRACLARWPVQEPPDRQLLSLQKGPAPALGLLVVGRGGALAIQRRWTSLGALGPIGVPLLAGPHQCAASNGAAPIAINAEAAPRHAWRSINVDLLPSP
jgi:hypothetical protein